MPITQFEANEIVSRANVNQRITQMNAYFPVSVANGGTGATSLNSGEILLGNGTGSISSTATLPVSKGGTGKSTLTSGEILLGNGTSGITSTSILSIEKGGTGSSSFYEKGSWTPTVRGTSGISVDATYSYRYGTYARVGNMVYIAFRLKCSITSASIPVSMLQPWVSGLPFSADDSTTNCMYPLSLIENYNIFDIGGYVVAYVQGSYIKVRGQNGADENRLKTGSDVFMGFGGWYKKS